MAQMVPFGWDDPFRLDEQLTEDERMIRDAAHAFAVVDGRFDNGEACQRSSVGRKRCRPLNTGTSRSALRLATRTPQPLSLTLSPVIQLR